MYETHQKPKTKRPTIVANHIALNVPDNQWANLGEKPVSVAQAAAVLELPKIESLWISSI